MAKLKKESKQPKHILYNLFHSSSSSKGLTKEEAKKPKDLKNFFPFITRNFNMLFALNIFAILGNFPLLFALYAFTGAANVSSTSAASVLFAPLYGAVKIDGMTPLRAAFYGIHGVQAAVSLPTQTTKVLYLLSLLVIFTFGIVNLATIYVMRNIVKGDPISFVSDIVYVVKKNWKQGMLFGIFDLVFSIVAAYDFIFFFVAKGQSFIFGALFGAMIVITCAWIMMRYYMYIMLVTFDLSVFKIIKNAFIFMFLGFKRNIVALLGMLSLLVLEYVLIFYALPVAVILPVLILISVFNFIGVYAAYPAIKKVMIDPYYVSDDVGAKTREEAEAEPEEEEEEPIFIDRG